VAINVSPRQLMDSHFVPSVLALLAEFQLPPSGIEIELTENALQTGAATLETLKKLRLANIAIALDDFGTGYSSLASLEQLPFTRVKLDRSLINSIDTNPRTCAITRSIIGLCHGLGLQLTAEGIERPEQFSMLSAYRAMHMQGYLLSMPLAAEAVPASLAKIREAAMLLVLTLPEARTESKVVDMTTALSRRAAESNRA
jgi:EAL domain-containing protein (putative c-di-GMP-specific phosphodiesterase class I)